MKFSIITICKNMENKIEDTIKSVVEQDFQDYEYIVVNGNSTDNTLNIISKYKDKITKIISEDDDGLYYAMNKGLTYANGDYVMFLNAGDKYYDNKVLSVVSNVIEEKDYDIFYGDLIFNNTKDHKESLAKQNSVNYIYLCACTVYHPTIFASRKLFDKIGNLNTDYKIVADYDWVLRALIGHHSSHKYIDYPITIFDEGNGVSTCSEFKMYRQKEKRKVQEKYFSRFEILIYCFLYKIMGSLIKIPVIKNLLRKHFLKTMDSL